MGEFTQNLLKLTEFPFSYSLLGLIALIFGQTTNTEDLSFNKIGPLLILTSFMATTLTIWDPIGDIQRRVLRGRPLVTLRRGKDKQIGFVTPIGADDLLRRKIFGVPIVSLFSTAYIFAMRYTPEEAKARIKIDWDSLHKETEQLQLKGVDTEKEVEELKVLDKATIDHLSILLNGIREQTVQTKWIKAEVDRINGLVYFMITIFLFIIASQLNPDFLLKFIQFFGNAEYTNIIILLLSIVALIVVWNEFFNRINGLREKAVTVFKYLVSIEAVKTDQSRQMFSVTFDKVERYLDEGHWTLARFGTVHIEEEYTEQFLQEVSK